MTIKKAITMFLLSVRHNVRMKIVENYFQHSINTVSQQF